MTGRLAFDFGTSNTRAALWDEGKQQAVPLVIPGISTLRNYTGNDGEKIEVSCVPSLINYDGNRILIGDQVASEGKRESPTTFKWMKRYISSRLELPRKVGDKSIKYSQAGADFLSRVIDLSAESIGLDNEEVAFTVPVEAYEHYQDWLTGVCEKAGINRYRLLDEASAAALGYGVSIQANDVYMVFDFGAGTLDVSIVKIESEPSGGKRCRVLGKGGRDVGGMTIDQWLYADLLKRNNKHPEDVRRLSSLLLWEVERVKEELTGSDRAETTVPDPDTGAVIGGIYSRTEFEEILEDNDMFNDIQSTIDHALKEALEKGYEKHHIKSVLLVGGSSLIPCVRRTVRRIFGKIVQYHRPLDAVALGGAAFVGGVDFYDHIQHDYAIKRYNRGTGNYEFKVIIKAGTSYPSEEPVFKCAIKATHNNQEFLGLEIYEVGLKHTMKGDNEAMLEIVFDPSGGARLTKRDDPEILRHYWMNEQTPTFVHADPPAMRDNPDSEGPARFPTSFSIDKNKRLCVSVFDNMKGEYLMKDHPLVKLT